MRKNAQLLLGLVVSVCALALAFRGANLSVMGDALRKANYFVLALGFLVYATGLLARAGSWNVLLGRRVPYWRAFDALNEGYLLNNLLPFRLGELGRAYLVSRRNGLPALEALSSIVGERVIDLLMVVILLLAYLPVVVRVQWARESIYGSIGLGVAAVVMLVVVASNQAAITRLVGSGLRRLNISWVNADAWQARTASLLAGLSAVREPRRALSACFFSLLAWACAGLGCWLVLNAFLPGASLPVAMVTLALAGIGGAVPSAPGSAGVFEFVIVSTLAAFGVNNSLALSFALVLHAITFALAIGLGGIALAREGETLAHLVRAAQDFVVARRSPETREPAAPEQ